MNGAGRPLDQVRERAARCGSTTCRPTVAGRSATSTTPAWPRSTRSAGRRWPCTGRPTAWTPPPSQPARHGERSRRRAGGLLDAPTGFVGRSPRAAPSRSCSPSRRRATPARTSRVRRWSCPAPRTPRSTRRRTTSACAPSSSTSTRDRRADPAAMAAAIDDSTVLVVASRAVLRPRRHRPVPAIAAAAAARGLRCHVDACIGGWVLPWLDRPPRLDVRRRWRHEHLGRPAQVRLHTQRRLDPVAPQRFSANAAALRLGAVARLHDAQHARRSRPSPAVRWPPPGPSTRRSAAPGMPPWSRPRGRRPSTSQPL